MPIRVNLLIGCTATGKSGAGLELARRLHGEIVSVDSMKIYRRMDIGTAKPSIEVRRRIPHHLIDVVEPSESFSLGRYVEQADRVIRDVASRGYFYSGLQPYAKRGSRTLEMNFYSYHLDKPGPWGARYEVQRRIPIEVGTWHCVERHMKLNSVDPAKADPAVADGVEELWVDGQLSIRKRGVRFRRVPELRITFFSLETYYHGLPAKYSREKPIKLYVDDLVVARTYVGPMKPAGR